MLDNNSGKKKTEAPSDSVTSDSKHELNLVTYECHLDCMLLKFITTLSEIRVTSIELYRAPLVDDKSKLVGDE